MDGETAKTRKSCSAGRSKKSFPIAHCRIQSGQWFCNWRSHQCNKISRQSQNNQSVICPHQCLIYDEGTNPFKFPIRHFYRRKINGIYPETTVYYFLHNLLMVWEYTDSRTKAIFSVLTVRVLNARIQNSPCDLIISGYMKLFPGRYIKNGMPVWV